ncbi:MAG: stage II sporulation protein R [Firmicutes bacterium]|nr:stage II sporulation protein R [Bacillota bacterium]
MDSKRRMAAAALILCVMAFYTSPAMQGMKAAPVGATPAAALANTDFLRFHVIANSDSPEDQTLKLRVRDGLLEEIQQDLAIHTMALADPEEDRVELTQEQVRDYVATHLEEIEVKGEQILRTLGSDQEIRACLEICEIPEKTYENVTFPEGEYEALNVTIGQGSGQNWWCVLFPPLCLIGAEPLQDTAAGRPDGLLPLPSRYDPLVQAAEEGQRTGQPVKLELRFKTLELFE